MSLNDDGWLSSLLRTAGLRLLTLPVTALISVLAASLSIRYVGPSAYGYVSLIAQLTLLLPFADLGLGTAVTRRVAQAKAGLVSWDEAVSLVAKSMAMLVAIGVAGGAAAAIVGASGGWSMIFDAPRRWASDVDVTTSVVLLTFFLLLPLAVSQRVLVGLGRSGLLVALGIVPPICNLAFVIAAGEAGLPPMMLALGSAVGSVVTVLTFALFAFVPRCGGIRFAPRSNGKPGQTLEVMHAAVPMLIASLGTAATAQSGRVLLAGTASDTALAEYAVALQLYLPLYSVIYMAATILWPRFSVHLDRALWRRANVILTGLGAAAGAGFLLFGPAIVAVMSDSSLDPSPLVFWSFAAFLTIQGLHATQSMLLTSPRGLWVQAAGATVAGGITVALTVATAQTIGPAAPILSAGLGLLVGLVIPSFVFSHRLLR